MPTPQLEAFAKKSGKSLKEVETLWNKAKDIVKKEYKDTNEGDDKFYALVTGTLKKMLSLNEEATTTTADIAVHPVRMPILKRLDKKINKKIFNEGTNFEKLCMILDEKE